MNIGIDIDGVICNFVSGFIKVIYDEYEYELKEENIIYHNLNMVLGISKEKMIQHIETTLSMDLPLIRNADKYINLLKEKNNIMILTARHVNHRLTEKWLKSNNVHYDELFFMTEGDKYKIDTDVDVIIEDNLNEALNWISRVKKVIIYDHPWNQSLDITNKIDRIKNWKQIYEIISNIK